MVRTGKGDVALDILFAGLGSGLRTGGLKPGGLTVGGHLMDPLRAFPLVADCFRAWEEVLEVEVLGRRVFVSVD